MRKLVSVPPSQRSLTNGMPQRWRFAADGVGRLPLRADEQHQAAVRRDLREILLRPQQAADRFADVDDVNEILAGVNVRPHLRDSNGWRDDRSGRQLPQAL